MVDAEQIKVIGYIREDTGISAEEYAFGIETQKQIIQKYCGAHNMIVDRYITDEGEPDAEKRDRLLDIIVTMNDSQIAGIVVAKSDRVSKNINIYFYYKFLLRRAGMELWSVSEDFGDKNTFSPVLEAFTMCAAQMEKENVRMRAGEGRHIKAKTGGYSGGSTPYGYTVIDGNLVIDPEEAEIVKEIFDLRDNQHLPLLTISEKLDEEGKSPRKGKRFYPSSVKSVIDNRKTYEGYYHYKGYKNGEWVKGQHEPILKKAVKDDELSK